MDVQLAEMIIIMVFFMNSLKYIKNKNIPII